MKKVVPYLCGHCKSCIGFSVCETQKCRFVTIERSVTRIVRPCNCGGFWVSKETAEQAERMRFRRAS